jgi:hypothetical protein
MSMALIKTATEKTALAARPHLAALSLVLRNGQAGPLCALGMPRLAPAARSSWSCAVCHTRQAGAGADPSCVYGLLAAVPRSSLACNRAHERKTARWERRMDSILSRA